VSRRLLCLVTTAALLVGCGGDDAAGEYRDNAERHCTAANDAADAVTGPSDTAESVARYAGAIAEIRRLEANRLRRLVPPQELKSDHDRLVSATDAVVAALESVEQAALQSNRSGAELASRQGQQAEQRRADAADALGLETCAQ
jgi:serine phosphatase RsbU (regulator of sigma subunit)